MKLRRIKVVFLQYLFLFTLSNLVAQSDYSESYDILRDSVYNSTNTTESNVLTQYKTTISLIENDNTIESNIKFSQCDYLMGLYYIDLSKIQKAIEYLESSMNWAKKANKINPTAQGYLAYAESLAQICPIMPTSFLIANGLKVPSISKKALKLDNKLGAARYLICSVIVYSPKPLKNLTKGKKVLKQILENDNLDKEDCFNVYKSFGYIYYQQKNFTEADIWLKKAAEIYPYNKFVLSMQNREYTKDAFVDIEPVIDSILEE